MFLDCVDLSNLKSGWEFILSDTGTSFICFSSTYAVEYSLQNDIQTWKKGNDEKINEKSIAE